MSSPRLYGTTGFADGVRYVPLPMLSCKTTESIDNNDKMVARIAWPPALPVTQRTCLRLFGADDKQREYRVTSLSVDPGNKWADITASGPFLSIARGGTVDNVNGGDRVFSFAGVLTVRQWVTAYVLQRLSADGLGWMSSTIGTVETDALLTLTFSRWNRTQLLQAIAVASNQEVYLSQSAPGSLYQVNFQKQRGSEFTPYTIAFTKNEVSRSNSSTDADLFTGVQPFGAVPDGDTEPANIGDNAWRAIITAAGWVQLSDPNGGANAIVYDQQFQGKYLEVFSGTTPAYRQILDARKSDGAVQLASTTGLESGRVFVRICENSSGDPLRSIDNPAAQAEYGIVRKPFEVSGGRAERNWVPNATFSQGTIGWTANGGGWVEAHPIGETDDIVAQANGTASSGSSLIAVDGIAPGKIIRKGTTFQAAAAAALTTTSHDSTIKHDGKAVCTSVSALAYSLADGDDLQIKYASGYSVLGKADGAHSSSVTTLNLKNLNGLTGTRQLLNGDKFVWKIGGLYTSLISAQFSIVSLLPYDAVQTISVPVVGFASTLVKPTTTGLASGVAVTLRDINSGLTFAATVHSAYTYGDTNISLDIWVPVDANYVFDPVQGTMRIQLEAFVQTVITKTNTAADQEFSETGTAAVTWSGALAQSCTDPNAALVWTDTSDAILGVLTVSSGAGASATSATLTNVNRFVVPSGAVISRGGIGNEKLYASATVIANASGQVTVPLIANSTITIGDNTNVTFYRNNYGWPAGNNRAVMRMHNGANSDPFLVFIPGVAPRNVVFSLTATIWCPVATDVLGILPLNIQMDILDANTNQFLGQASVPVPVPNQNDGRPAPSTATAVQTIAFTSSRMVRLAARCGIANSLTAPLAGCFVDGVSAYVTQDQAVPIIDGSHANALQLAGTFELQTNAVIVGPIEANVIEFARVAGMQKVRDELSVGRAAYFRNPNITQRVVTLAIDHFNILLSSIRCDRVAATVSQQLANL